MDDEHEEVSLELENANLRELLERAGLAAAEQKTVERLQRILLEELHHRVKNNLATVQAIVDQSLRSAANIEAGRQAIINRVVALGRVHDLLLRTDWEGIKLADLLKTATEPFDTPGNERFVIQSSDLDVGPAAALPLALSLNELCTNAIKYGALSNSEGKVHITVKADPQQDQFRLTWTERGGPTVEKPTRRSFGMRLIERSFVGKLQGRARVIFEAAGVICELDIPLSKVEGGDV